MECKNKVLIIVSIIVFILMGLFCINSNAAYVGSHSSGLQAIQNKGRSAVGDTVTANLSDLTGRRDLYCIMYHKSLHGNVTYRVGRYIAITGNTATNDVGQSYTSLENGKLAYILCQNQGYGAPDSYTSGQSALYGTINGWYSAVGQRLGINRTYSHNNAFVNASLISAATDYAKSLGNTEDEESAKIVDKTEKKNITVTAYSNDGSEYLRVGPFKWKFADKLTSVSVYGDGNKTISDVRYSRFEGNKEKFYNSANDIESNKEFYISVKANTGITKIGKITAKQMVSSDESTSYMAEMWFLNSTYMQDLLLVNTGREVTGNKPDKVENKFDYNIGLIKDIELVKIDSIKTDKKLNGVGFILQNKETGKYLKKSGSEYKFVDKKESATEFVTGLNGKVSIKGVPVAVYVAYETVNPTYGYEIPENGTTISVNDTTKTIKNDYKLGKFRIEKVDKKYTDKKLPDVEFTLFADSGRYKGQYVGVDAKGNAYYSKTEVHIKTNSNGVIEINDIWEGNYILTEVKNPNYGYIIDDSNKNIKLTVKPYETTSKQVTNEYKLGKIDIEKVDSNHAEIKLKNVEFTLKAITGQYAGKYVAVDAQGNALYVPEEAHIKTNDKGKIAIDKVWEGKYVLTEVNNPNYGYIIDENCKVLDVEVKPYETFKYSIKNEQVYIKLSGFIWNDIHSGKTSLRNDYYKTNGMPNSDYVDDQDTAFNGISVKLKRISDGSIVKEGYSDRKEFTNKDQVTTSEEKGLYEEIEGGEYVFDYVRVDELSNYYVEFEYDGLIYQSVISHLDHNNGSKASDHVERDIFDKNFAMINSTGKNVVNVNNGNSDVYHITYTDTVDHQASVKDSSDCILHAKTNDADCNINNYFVPGQTEIRYINLGLYERPKADMALAQDLDNVNVGVNGYWHIYKYGTRKVENSSSDSWNVGVKFKSSYTDTYRRAIYKADAEYQTEDKSKELQVYLTYKIALKNESSYITRVNSVIDYFDNRYTLVGAGTGVDDHNNITGNVKVGEIYTHNDKYKKCIIDVNSTVEAGKTNFIFVQFKLDREAVLEIINNKETLYNRTEITSYTVFKDDKGNTVMTVDQDSVPGNTDIDNDDTYEDDVDSAPPVQLEINKNARQIEGNVFVDTTTNELKTGQIRQGNGIFDNGEKTVEGVRVTLHELNNSIPDMVVDKTDANGYFKFEGYIPGKYIVTYTWGDKTYTVQNYKGTVYDVTRKQKDMYWYRGSEYENDTISVNDRKSDAIDNYDTRKAIDNETAAITDNTINDEIIKAYNGDSSSKINITKMDSTTPTMEFSVEYDTIETDGTIDKVEFIVKNVDFGIVERARQQLDMTKRVKSFKIVLANGQVLADATIGEDGKLEGNHNSMTYMAPSYNNGFKFNGYVRAEIDNELLEGAKLELGYEIKAINNSELDFMSEEYYKYGVQKGSIVTLTPSAVVDYLDKNLGFEATDNPDWKVITVDELSNLKATKVNDTDFLNSRLLLYTESTAKPLKPTEKVDVTLNVSKLMTTSNDNTFSNDAETVKVEKPKGSTSTLPDGSVVLDNSEHTGSVIKYFPADNAEQVEITPSTGADKDYVVPVIIGVTSLLILSSGVFVIKRKVIDK